MLPLLRMATAVSACHWLIKHANAKRILFLVDRNNLGRQCRKVLTCEPD